MSAWSVTKWQIELSWEGAGWEGIPPRQERSDGKEIKAQTECVIVKVFLEFEC
jgi:hypothetical protein